MPLKPLGHAPYLLPDDIEQDDVVTIIDKPYIVPAEKTKWGKERGKAKIRILRTGEERTWTMNNSTWNALIREFGEDPDQWINKKAQIKKQLVNISGVNKQVLFGKPYHEPQQKLDPPDPHAEPIVVKSDLIRKISALSPEYKQQLKEMLNAEETKQ